MAAKRYRLDLVQTETAKPGKPREWYWLFVSNNGKTLAKSSESYKRRADCDRCAALTLGVRLPAGATLTDGQVLASGARPAETVVRVLS